MALTAQPAPRPSVEVAAAARLLALCLGFLVVQLDATIVNVALPAIGRDVGGSLAGLQWVVDGYTLPLAAVMLPAGAAADRFGARRAFEAGLVVFGLASAACAAAPDLPALIAARAVQGVGAAALLPASLALIVHEFPAREARARALGLWGGIAGVGLAAGPVLGGVAVALLGWRAVFVVNVPVAVAGVALVRRFVGESPRHADGRLDVAGPVLGTATLACLTAAFIEAGERGWSAALPAVLLGAAVAGGIAFVAAERRAAAPMLPLALFRVRPFGAGVAMGVLFNLCLYGTLLCLSLYLQRARGHSALATGLEIMPMTVVIGLGAFSSGRLTARFGPRRPMAGGMALAGAGTLVLSLVGPASPLALVLGGSLVVGLCSLAMPAMTGVVVGAVGSERAGLASGVLNAARQAGGALGVALLGALLGSGAGERLDLHTAMPVATAGYVLALALAWVATGERRA